jgi:MFS family permease
VVGFFAGTFVNRLGVKITLSFGGLGYCIYAISLLASEHADVTGFNIFAGALLGVCAGLLWTAQGTIMLSYPGEAEKGKYFAWFWAIFNLGGVIGSLVSISFMTKSSIE